MTQKHFFSVSKSCRRRRQIREEDLRIVESDTKEVLIEKFLLLRDAYDELKDDTTRLEFELESLKDAQDDGEEEVSILHCLLIYYINFFFLDEVTESRTSTYQGKIESIRKRERG